jgi:uncharacterized membrane protein (UPF0127 family)
MNMEKRWAMYALLLFASLLLVALAMPPPNYELSNLTKKKSVKISLTTASNPFERMRGLMFRPKIIPMLFIFGSSGRFPIHSHFVVAEFDAIYVGNDGVVVEVFRRVPPNKDLVLPTKDASFLLELPMEITDNLRIEEGDRLEWKKIQ